MPDTGTAFAISAPSIFDGAHFLQDHCVIVRDQVVERLAPLAQCPPALDVVELADGTQPVPVPVRVSVVVDSGQAVPELLVPVVYS